MSKCMIYCSISNGESNTPINVNYITTYFRFNFSNAAEKGKPSIKFVINGNNPPINWIYEEEKDREVDMLRLRKLLEIQVGKGLNG